MSKTDLNVLIVDDDDLDVYAFEHTLQRTEAAPRMHKAFSGKQAFDILRNDPGLTPASPLIIFLDLTMPLMSGFEFLDGLRKDPEWSRAVVFILTGSARPEDVRRAYRLGVSGFLLKDDVVSDDSPVRDLVAFYAKHVHFPQ